MSLLYQWYYVYILPSIAYISISVSKELASYSITSFKYVIRISSCIPKTTADDTEPVFEVCTYLAHIKSS